MLKVYETIGTLNRTTVVSIEGREIHVAFINGTDTPRLIQGRYSTTNPKIQQALEDSPAFNVRWKLVKALCKEEPVIEDPLPEVEDPVIEEQKVEDPDDDKAMVLNVEPADLSSDDKAIGSLPEETDEDLPQEETPDSLIVETVLNGQQARNYLIEHFGLTFRQVSNNNQIITEAKSRGIQFINWEAFVSAE